MDPPPEAPVDINSPSIKELIKSIEVPERSYSFVSRKQWRAAKPRKTRRIRHPVAIVNVNYHWGNVKCLDRKSCEEFLQNEQRRLIRECGEDDIPFHFLVGDDGTVYEGRGWHFVSSRTFDHPLFDSYGNHRIDIAYIGNYEDEDRYHLAQPVMAVIEHGVVMKYVQKDWALIEVPLTPDELPDPWPPKRQGPPLPRLWW